MPEKRVRIGLRQFEALEELAEERGQTVETLLFNILDEYLRLGKYSDEDEEIEGEEPEDDEGEDTEEDDSEEENEEEDGDLDDDDDDQEEKDEEDDDEDED